MTSTDFVDQPRAGVDASFGVTTIDVHPDW